MFFRKSSVRYADRSSQWPKIRKEHLANNPSCIACGRSKKVEVHHIEPVHKNPDRELDPSNLVTLCADPCHIVFGHFLDFKKYNPDVIEMCNIYYTKYVAQGSGHESNIFNF